MLLYIVSLICNRKSVKMQSAFILLVLGFAAAAAVPRNQKIVGGSVTTIEQYPFGVGMLHSGDLLNYGHACGGAILNTRSILSAAHCFYFQPYVLVWRVRVGSTWADSGGVVHSVSQIINHPSFNYWTADHDITVIRVTAAIIFNNQARPASISGTNYNLADNQAVWAIGWGLQSWQGSPSEQLRHVQIWTVKQATCRNRYAELGYFISDYVVCSGWLDVGGRGQCQGDSGGPLVHNSVVVGVTSWGEQCAHARYPAVSTRVSRYTTWIQANA